MCGSVASAHLGPVFFHHSAAAEGRTCCLWTTPTDRLLKPLSFRLDQWFSVSTFSLFSLLSSSRLSTDALQELLQKPAATSSLSSGCVMVVVHQSYVSRCLNPHQTQTSSKVTLPPVVFLCRPLAEVWLVKAHSNSCCMQSLSRLCWIFYLFQMVINVFQASLTSLLFSRMSQFMRITSSGQIHTCDILLRLLIMES